LSPTTKPEDPFFLIGSLAATGILALIGLVWAGIARQTDGTDREAKILYFLSLTTLLFCLAWAFALAWGFDAQ
jgi:hypothetical protein